MTPSVLSAEPIDWDELKDQITADLENRRTALEEIQLKLDQSQTDIQKLTQRNTSITGQLHQLHGKVETLSRTEIQAAYDSALEALQRLSVMRIQSEKLQSEKNHNSELIEVLETFQKALEAGGAGGFGKKGDASSAHVVEMLIQAQESERQRLSRQMHDGPAQALSNFILQTEIAMRLFDVEEDQARAELEGLRKAATTTFQKVRDFIFELRPMMLDDLGLVPTVKRYIEIIQDGTKSDIRLNATGRERRLESFQEAMLFRAVQELLYNAIRHSRANIIKVQIDMGESTLKITVDDDGKGFDPAMLEIGNGVGLKVIRDRLNMVNGTCAVDSAPGQGARIMIESPVLERKS